MRLIARCAAALVALLAAASTAAAEWPERRLSLIVQSAPAGSPDILARIVGERLGKRLGQPVVILNMPGAGGNIAMKFTAVAEPDGYTVMVVADSLAINPSLFRTVPYARDSFASVVQGVASPQVLVANSKLTVRTLGEFVAAAKKEPGKFSVASPAIGTTGHLGVLLLQREADIRLNPIAYRSAQPALTDALGQHVDGVMVTLAPALPLIKDGQLRALAVSTEQRSPSLPDVPTFVEAGYPKYSFDSWLGFVVPAKTPPAIVERLNREINAILAEPEIRQQLLDQAFVPVGGSAADFDKVIARTHDMWRTIIVEQKIQAE